MGASISRPRCFPNSSRTDLVEMVHVIECALQSEGIVSKVTAEIDGRACSRARRRLRTSLGSKTEWWLRECRPSPACPRNLIVLAIEEKLDRPVELAEIKLEDGACKLLLVSVRPATGVRRRRCREQSAPLYDAVASIPSGSHVALSGFAITRCTMAFRARGRPRRASRA